MSIGSEVPGIGLAAMTRAPAEVAQKHGVVPTNPDGANPEFVEKPTLAGLREHFAVHESGEFDRLAPPANVWCYLADFGALGEVAGHPDFTAMRCARALISEKELLPWLVGGDRPVHAHIPADGRPRQRGGLPASGPGPD